MNSSKIRLQRVGKKRDKNMGESNQSHDSIYPIVGKTAHDHPILNSDVYKICIHV